MSVNHDIFLKALRETYGDPEKGLLTIAGLRARGPGPADLQMYYSFSRNARRMGLSQEALDDLVRINLPLVSAEQSEGPAADPEVRGVIGVVSDLPDRAYLAEAHVPVGNRVMHAFLKTFRLDRENAKRVKQRVGPGAGLFWGQVAGAYHIDTAGRNHTLCGFENENSFGSLYDEHTRGAYPLIVSEFREVPMDRQERDPDDQYAAAPRSYPWAVPLSRSLEVEAVLREFVERAPPPSAYVQMIETGHRNGFTYLVMMTMFATWQLENVVHYGGDLESRSYNPELVFRTEQGKWWSPYHGALCEAG